MRESASPVSLAAAALGAGVVKTDDLDDSAALLPPTRIAVTAAFGLRLPDSFLARFPCGVLNVHPSLLPRHRGPCPVERAVLEGDSETGISFMLTDEGWDTGPLLSQERTPILPGETAGELSGRLSVLAARLLPEVLRCYLRGGTVPMAQTGAPSYAAKITDRETWLDWSEPAVRCWRRVRALSPSPGARTRFRGRVLRIVSASCSMDAPEVPQGRLAVAGGRLFAGCAGGVLELSRVQPESRRAMDAGAFIAGYRPGSGEEFA